MNKYNRKRTIIKDLLTNYDNYIDKIETICGWIQTTRKQSELFFVSLNDGSCANNVQIIFSNEYYKNNIELIKEHLNTGASIKINGLVIKSPAKGQEIEIQCHYCEILGKVDIDSDYPLPKTALTPDYLRTIPHMRIRRPLFSCISRIRDRILFSTHSFMQNNNYKLVNTPLITSGDCEGAGESFCVTNILKKNVKDLPCNDDGTIDYTQDFFGEKIGLTVSGQLHLECAVPGLGDCYTLGPTFRAENSNTTRHLAEFWMLEIESAFMNLEDLMDISEDYVKFVIKNVLDNNKEDLDLLCKVRNSDELINNLKNTVENNFVRISYTEVINILQEEIKNYNILVKSNYPNISDKEWRKKTKNKDFFENGVYWGIDLFSEHEKWICEKKFNKCCMVYNYPKDIKSFYMKENDNCEENKYTVQAMDVLVPGIGELIGGSVRESSYDKLEKRMDSIGICKNNLKWYLDLRKYGNSHSAGMGLGVERLISYITGTPNIRDCIQFPRTPGNILC